MTDDRDPRRIPFRGMIPNAITALALCFGLTGIRFGSRVDVYLASGTSPRVLLGQRAIAGETVLAEIGVDATLTGISQ